MVFPFSSFDASGGLWHLLGIVTYIFQLCLMSKLGHKSTVEPQFVLLFVRLSLLTMTNPNQLCDVLLFVCSKMADETNLGSKLPVADRTREV